MLMMVGSFEMIVPIYLMLQYNITGTVMLNLSHLLTKPFTIRLKFITGCSMKFFFQDFHCDHILKICSVFLIPRNTVLQLISMPRQKFMK